MSCQRCMPIYSRDSSVYPTGVRLSIAYCDAPGPIPVGVLANEPMAIRISQLLIVARHK